MKREETVDYHIKTAWHAISRMYNQQALKYDLTMSMGYVLLNINFEEGTPATKIAPMMGLESRSLTRLLKSMEADGLIYRETDGKDKRSVRIMLTKKGRKKRENAKHTVLVFNEEVRRFIPQAKLKIFFEVVGAICENIEKNAIYPKES